MQTANNFLVVLMLLHLYSAFAASSDGNKHVKLGDEESRRPNGRPVNGNARAPNIVDRQAQDAQEFELEGLMSDAEDDVPQVKAEPMEQDIPQQASVSTGPALPTVKEEAGTT